MKTLFHAFLLFLSFGLVFTWEQTSLVNYTVQALALLVLFYLLISIIRKKRNPKLEMFGSASDIFILTTAILLLINVTGNLYSPIFFLLYFLGFGITFIFEPMSVFFFTLATILIFLPQALKNNSIESYVRLGSIVLISPLAYFFGREYSERAKQEEKLEMKEERLDDLAKTIEKDVQEVMEQEKEITTEAQEKLIEVIEEAKELKEEAIEK